MRGGWNVFATARQPATLDELAAAGCHVLALDVTSEDSMQAALAAIDGGVSVLIDNAGYSQSGALETLPMNVPVTASARMFIGLRRVLPERAWDRVVGASFR